MSAQATHLEFAPPPPRGTARSVGAALVVHGLLIVALTAGIQWKQDNNLSVEAELWSAVPMAAAPPLVEAEPPPPPPPPPKPVVKAPEPPAPNRDAEIALAKKRKVEEEKKLQDALKAEERRKEEVKKEAEKKAKAKLEAKKEEDRKDKERKEKEKEKERADKERKEKEAKKQQEQKDSKAAAAEEAKKLEAIRKENMKRMTGLAGASGADNATGTAMKASGPSDSYGGRIRGRIKPNITFDPSSVVGNPAAEVEVRCAPDGTIVSSKLVKSSGSHAWDNAVLKAITKTEILPRDTDGRVHSPLLLVFKPND